MVSARNRAHMDDADDHRPFDAGRAGLVVLAAATLAVLAAFLPWVHEPNAARTGFDLVGFLAVAFPLAAFVALFVGEWTTATKLVVGALGLCMLGVGVLAFLDATSSVALRPGVGSYLAMAAGLVVAVVGSGSVLLEPPVEDA